MDTIENQMKELEAARKVAEDFAKQRQRQEGELDGLKKHLKELQDNCQTKYGCKIEDLSKIIDENSAKVANSLKESKTILKMN